MYRLITNSAMPKWLKVLLYTLLTLTCVYWIGLLIYKILEAIRKFIHWASERRNWWTFLMCILILLIGSLLIAQFALGLDPVGKCIEWFIGVWQNFKQTLGNLIAG